MARAIGDHRLIGGDFHLNASTQTRQQTYRHIVDAMRRFRSPVAVVGRDMSPPIME